MSRRIASLQRLPPAVLFFFSFCAPLAAVPVETGDFDGDSRLSIADVVWSYEGLPAAPGSMDGFTSHVCFDHWSDWDCHWPLILGGIVHLESLRRAVRDPLPHWVPIWHDGNRRQEPLDPHPGVRVRWGSVTAAGGSSDVVYLELLLENLVPVRAFSLLVRSEEGILRVPVLEKPFDPSVDWLVAQEPDPRGLHDFGELAVRVGHSPYLITRGTYVISYGLDGPCARDEGIVLPGSRILATRARLPLETPAGEYGLAVLDGSEVLLDDGRLVAPTVEEPGRLLVEQDVTVGWDGDVPPLQLDAPEGQVLGRIEYRVTDAEGFPGDTVRVRTQMRTEVPLNDVYLRMTWPSGKLDCASRQAATLFANPEDGRPYEPYKLFRGFCSPGGIGFLPGHEVMFSLEGRYYRSGNDPERPFAYFKPLGEWVDLTEIELTIPDRAGGGTEIPLSLSLSKQEFLPAVANGWPATEFRPYGMNWLCAATFGDEGLSRHEWEDFVVRIDPAVGHGPFRLNWEYEEIVLHHGTVTVLGNQAPVPDPPLPDAGIRWILDDVRGTPGELVDVPIWAAAEFAPLFQLLLVVEVDPSDAVIESVVIETLRVKTGETVPIEVPEGTEARVFECEVPGQMETCSYGIPGWIGYRDFYLLEERFAVILITPSNAQERVLDYPGEELRRLGALRVRVREDFVGETVAIRHTIAPASQTTWDFDIRSGAWFHLDASGHLSPAVEARDATIHLRPGEATFQRGDANADSRMDLSDAIAILNYLFVGGSAPGCLDAADADDSGVVEITDPIFALSTLFLGGHSIPPPHPDCGFDGTADELGCDLSNCEER